MPKGRAIRLAQKYSPRQYIGYTVGIYNSRRAMASNHEEYQKL
jgi:hypothetical protein